MKALPNYPPEIYADEDEYIEVESERSMQRVFYRKGYEQAEKDIGWNSVEKSLPPMGEEVIVLTNEMNGHELPNASHLCFAHLVDRRYAMDYNGWNIPGVKYWMNCPDLPEE